MTDTSLELRTKSWRDNVPSSIETLEPSLVYTNLYDLIKGNAFSHNAFYYCQDILGSDSKPSAASDNSPRYSIDLSLPIYDEKTPRRKYKVPSWMYNDEFIEGQYIYLPRREDVVYPKTCAEAYSSHLSDRPQNRNTGSSDWSTYTEADESGVDSSFIQGSYVNFRAKSSYLSFINSFSISTESGCDFLVSNENEYLTKNLSVNVYSTLALNLDSTSKASSVASSKVEKLTWYDKAVSSEDSDGTSYYSDYTVNVFIKLLFVSLGATFIQKSSTETLFIEALAEKIAEEDSDTIILLKKINVFVKAPFVADYVNKSDFGQELHQSSSVGHRNLILSTSGSADRLENADDKYDSSQRPAYISSQIPIKDALENRYYETIKTTQTGVFNSVSTSTIAGQLAELQQRSFLEKYDIGQTLEDSFRYTTAHAPVVHTGYFDPDLIDYSTYASRFSLTSRPRVVPLEGNLWTDGRIFSPTIDELWFVIKKLISGRSADSISSRGSYTDSPDTRYEHNYIDARPVGYDSTLVETFDSRLSEIRTVDFAFTDSSNASRVGDPIEVLYYDASGNSYTSDRLDGVDIVSTKVSKYLTQPDQNKLYILPRLAELINQHSSYTDVSSSIYSILPRDLVAPSGEEDYKYSLLDGKSLSYWYEKYSSGDLNTSTEVSTVVGGRWSPRIYPMSLRELESNIYSNRFNIESTIEWVFNDFVQSGRYNFTNYGWNGDSSNVTKAAAETQSTLFQLHKQYNHKANNPNTLFNLYHVDDEASTLQTYKSTDSYTQVANQQFGVNINYSRHSDETAIKDLDGRDRATYTYRRLPIYAKNYSQDEVDSQYEFNTSHVFLAVDGEYHYCNAVDGKVRIPTLLSRY